MTELYKASADYGQPRDQTIVCLPDYSIDNSSLYIVCL